MERPALIPTLIPYTANEVGAALGSPATLDGYWARKADWVSDEGVVFDQRSSLGDARPVQPLRAMQLNGTNQYGVYSLREPIAQYPFTLFGWAQPSTSAWKCIFAINSIGSGEPRFGVYVRPDNILVERRANVTFQNNVNIASSAGWRSYVISFNSSTSFDIYYDGLLAQSFSGLDAVAASALLDRMTVGSLRSNTPTQYWQGKAMHCGYLRRAATLEDAQTFHTTGIIPNAEGLFPLTSNSTTIEYNIGTEGEPFARRNLFIWTEEFDNSIWNKPGTGIDTSIGTSGIEPNVSVSPEIRATADRVHFINQSDVDVGLRHTLNAVGGQTYTASIWVKGESSNIGKQVRLRLRRNTTGGGAFTTQSFALTAEWVRISVSLTLAPDNVDIQLVLSSNVGEATSALIWGAQLELGSTPTDYQRITTGIYTNEMSLINGAAGMLYTGRDVPFSRQNEVGYSPRRNLLLHTRDFSNAYWEKQLATISGQKLIPNNGSSLGTAGNGVIAREIPVIHVISGRTYSASIRAKAAEFNRIRFRFMDGTIFTQVNCVVSLVDGTVVTPPVTSAQFSSVSINVSAEADGWFRVAITGTYTGTSGLIIYAFAADSVATTGNGTSGILIDQVHFQEGPIGQYQQIGTDPGASVLFPATLPSPGKSAAGDDLQFAGPVPMNGQAEESNAFSFDGVDDIIGVDLDGVAGDELVTNGDFSDGLTGWTLLPGAVDNGGVGVLDATSPPGDNTIFSRSISGLTAGKYYLVRFDRVSPQINTTSLFFGNSSSGYSSTLGKSCFVAKASGTTSTIFGRAGSLNQRGVFDNISIKELPFASHTVRQNFISNSGFDTDTVWTKGTGWTIGSGVATATSVVSGVGVSQPATLRPNVEYRITYTVSSVTSGGARVVLTGSTPVVGTLRNSAGTYTEDLFALAGNNAVSIQAGPSGFSGTIDNVTVQPMQIINSQGTSLLSYHPQGLGITGTAGTAYEIKLGDVAAIPCTEGTGSKVHDTIRNVDYNIVNGQVSNWFSKQNTFPRNLTKGFTFKNNTPPIDPVATLGLSTRMGAVYDFADVSTLFQDRAGTTPVTAPGQLIGQFHDKSPNNLHATAVSDVLRGVWAREPKTGRRNLLQQTEVFDNAFWQTGNSTVVANVEANPLTGAVDADRMTTSAANGEVRALGFTYPSTGIYTLSCYVKSETLPQIILRLDRNTNTANASFTFATETVSTVGANILGGTFTRLGNGWYRLTATANVVSTGFVVGITAGVATGSILLWGAQLETGSAVTPYQRVTTAFDVTEEGVPYVYSIARGSTNMAYTTPSADFSGTDEITVVGGFEPTADTANAILVELSSDSSSNNSTFMMERRSSGGYGFRSKGSLQADVTVSSGTPTGTDRVVAGLGDISTDLCAIRINGVQALNSGDQGTGNFSNNILYIFARNGNQLWFHGRCYRLALGGDNYDLANVQAIEDWTSDNTPTIPRLHVLEPWRLPASDSNPGFDVEGNPLTNPPVVGHNNAETKINFSPVANSWHESYSIPGADLPTYAFDGDPGDIDLGIDMPAREASFHLRKQ